MDEVGALAVICGTIISVSFIQMIKSIILRPSSREKQVDASPAVLEELRALREEVRQIQRTNDVILTYEATLERLEQRVGSLERAAGKTVEEEKVDLRVGLGR
jgi:ubiquinone biosynthesis protein UbiJ